MSEKFTWIPLYKEIATTLLKYENNQQGLIDLIKEMSAKGFITIVRSDKQSESKQIELDEIDPFTFFANFNRVVKDVNRLQILEFLIKKLSLKSPMPTDFSGIPLVNNLRSLFFSYKIKREKDAVASLWKLFREALSQQGISKETFNKVIGQRGIFRNITFGLFWIAPERYISIDKPNEKYLGFKISKDTFNYDSYFTLIEKIKERKKPFYVLSYEAYMESTQEGSGEPSEGGDVDPVESDGTYWLYATGENAYKWEEFYEKGIMGIGWDNLGDLSKFKSKDDIVTAMKTVYKSEREPRNNALACYEFSKVMKIGDIVIAKKGTSIYLGYGIVASDYIYDESRDEYLHIRKITWQKKGEWAGEGEKIVQKTLTNITKYPDYVNRLKQLLGIEDAEPSPEQDDVQTIPLNQILYGPPGTGKTYSTIDLATKIIGVHSDKHVENKSKYQELLGDQIEFITFHQNYAYEDFIQGLRPDLSKQGTGALSFVLRDGIFKRIADRALESYHAFKMKTDNSKKPPFRKVFDAFIQPLDNGEVEEIEVKMAKVSFFINKVSEKSIFFRKQTGQSEHSLSIGTLSEMYYSEGIPVIEGGLNAYYIPLSKKLLEMAETMSVEVKTEPLKNYVLIIDEINRANISRVFGELITLLEEDKRFDRSNAMVVTLPSGETFTVPPNLFIVGTMNTADKSIALLDIALRRRFVFKKVFPNPSLVKSMYRDLFEKLNAEIIKQKGPDFQIGHSFFMDIAGGMFNLWETMNNKIIPLLYEYFMNDGEAVERTLNKVGVKTITNMGMFEFATYDSNNAN